MPKHKQFLKSEKAKVKLKGAKLPKGLNVTKTDFKVKKIVIREQIQDNFNPDGSIKHQNIKELLSKLQHHNSTNRNEGIRYLKDILIHNPQESSKHLNAIIQGISQLSLDIEKDVRKEGFKALGLLLSTTPADAISPFFDIISSYLRCAMTHLSTAIQEDSLFMLDELLLHVPNLVTTNSDKIFACFLDMISKLRTESKHERTLSVNLGSKITSVKWRSKVLDRLVGMMRAMVDSNKNKSMLQEGIVQNSAADTMEDAFTLNPKAMQSRITKSIPFTVNKQMNFSLVRKHLNVNCNLPQLFRKPLSSSVTSSNLIDCNDEGKRIQNYTELLMPLMFETWMEVRPPSYGNEFETYLVISIEAAHSLKTILQIIEQIFELIRQWDAEVNNTDLSKWFIDKYNKEFCAQFFSSYPYSQNDGYKGSKKKAKGVPTEQEVYDSGGIKCYTQNLSIILIFSSMNCVLSRQYHGYAEKCLLFLNKNIENFHSANLETSQSLLNNLRTILLLNGENWNRANVKIKTLLASTIRTYQKNKFSKDVRTKVLVLLCDIVMDIKLCKLYGYDLFEHWLQALPKMLLQPFVPIHVMTAFSCLAKQQNQLFLKNFKANIPQILDNLPEIQVGGVEDQFEGNKLIINLFYWLDSKDLQMEQYSTEKLNVQCVNYLKEILYLKKISL